ncbi:MAG: indole-3-glycerol-phosphate synthase [Nitrospinae bacterium]|nr:indole-3-glycerol-phosphate synthase [Nitrospinota bacterium]
MTLAPILAAIVAHKRDEVAAFKRSVPAEGLAERAAARREEQGAARSLVEAMRRHTVTANVIAEVKRASPSRMLRPVGFDPVAIAKGYETAGAAAISCLTDARFFCGSGSYVPLIRHEVGLPVLRKEFVIDPIQLVETAALGADAVLLMAILFDSPDAFAEMYETAEGLGLTPLVEIGDENEWERVAGCEPELVGINNRDFASPDLALDLARTERLAPGLPGGVTLVSESGVSTPADIVRLKKCGVSGFLIGSALMKEDDPGGALASLLAGVAAHR